MKKDKYGSQIYIPEEKLLKVNILYTKKLGRCQNVYFLDKAAIFTSNRVLVDVNILFAEAASKKEGRH